MGPHKNPPLEERLDRVESDIVVIKQTLKGHTKRFIRLENHVNHGFKEVNARFDKQERQLISWKNQLFSKIDKFIGRIDKQDKEIASIAFRKEEHEQRVSKLEKSAGFITA